VGRDVRLALGGTVSALASALLMSMGWGKKEEKKRERERFR